MEWGIYRRWHSGLCEKWAWDGPGGAGQSWGGWCHPEPAAMLDWRPCESHRTPLPASESPSSLGLGGIGPGGESPPKEKKKKKKGRKT